MDDGLCEPNPQNVVEMLWENQHPLKNRSDYQLVSKIGEAMGNLHVIH